MHQVWLAVPLVIAGACRHHTTAATGDPIAYRFSGEYALQPQPWVDARFAGVLTLRFYAAGGPGWCLGDDLIAKSDPISYDAELLAGGQPQPYTTTIIEPPHANYPETLYPVMVLEQTRDLLTCEDLAGQSAVSALATGGSGPTGPCCPTAAPAPVIIAAAGEPHSLSFTLKPASQPGTCVPAVAPTDPLRRCKTLRYAADGSDSACYQALGTDAATLINAAGAPCPPAGSPELRP